MYIGNAKIPHSGRLILNFKAKCASDNVQQGGTSPFTNRRVWRRGGYGRINGGMRVLELAADIWEAWRRLGARSKSTNAHEIEKEGGGLSLTLVARRTTAKLNLFSTSNDISSCLSRGTQYCHLRHRNMVLRREGGGLLAAILPT
jgi:hypothetical protein